ncbi:hemerythrin family protein [Campylobacter jejuni]|uniref:hemerythrin family protein n=1 Tax=Campylobacter jejuni TaxID=197 RepID=UPI000F8135C3|nr:bacteriohemerythrin [Campylobacter jejuni]RTI84037.1 iron-binding protein [Campylobacter jejuni]RTI90446.1 iron-binding protein [Campylobacter jejuni]RTJ14074.1 iron-binding protein [Campylobacter jejuni]RTJ54658.1 iron-binding protein [Campylobacter jejuni]RTJ99218.1 iron-binding protein [Campylobacter jejuni]
MEVKWSRDFSIKNMQLDKQHELIFEIANLANDLALKIQDNDVQHKNDLKQILTKLLQYVKIHFKDEEKFMESIDFPLIEEHRKSHQILLKKTKELLEHSNDIVKLSLELSTLTKDWILDHFAIEDLWIANFTKKALHLQEIHYNLEQYIKLKSIRQDLKAEKTYDYICNCYLRTHAVPQTIHEELVSKENTLKCEKCGQILVHLDYVDLNQDYEILNHTLENIGV